MKRTNLVLDEQLLLQAARVLGAKTYSAAVNTALEEVAHQKDPEYLRILGIRHPGWRSVRNEERPSVAPASAQMILVDNVGWV